MLFSFLSLSVSLSLFLQETSLRPDIRYGRVATTRAESASPVPPSLGHTPSSTHQLDYASPFICRINLSLLQGHAQQQVDLLCPDVMVCPDDIICCIILPTGFSLGWHGNKPCPLATGYH